jgi:sialate O-acetylesterase
MGWVGAGFDQFRKEIMKRVLNKRAQHIANDAFLPFADRILGFACLVTAIAAIGAAAAVPAQGEVHLPHLLSDHAVLQRERPIHIWGWSAAAEKVAVKFHEQSAETVADGAGRWSVWLKPEVAGGPYVLDVTGSETETPVVRTDILVGDVWVASGQSNMEFPLVGFGPTMPLKNSEKEIAGANQPQIRLLLEATRISMVPMGDIAETWMLCTPDTVKSFSAVAYFFGRQIVEKEHVPVGLIDASVGGTPAQAWTSMYGLGYANLSPLLTGVGEEAEAEGQAVDRINEYAQEDEEMKAAGKPVAERGGRRPVDHHGDWMPAVLYNGMIAPLTRLPIKGAIWYQGEHDAAEKRAPYYQRLFSAMIEDWRRQWAEGEFPFLFVQLSSVGDSPYWGAIRDAQRRSLAVSHTGMAVSLDVGRQDHNPHPADKQTVADRLGRIALATVYGEKYIAFEEPRFQQATFEGASIRAWFSHAAGLHSSCAAPGDLEIAGANHKFVPASATIETLEGWTTLVAHADGVKAPRYIRYGWSSYVSCYLYNASGLPMGTFTSENETSIVNP